jgi:N-acetylglutamate synthase-like GNAT family acetyltransferase
LGEVARAEELMHMNIELKKAGRQDQDFYIQLHHVAYRKTIEKMFGWDEEFQNQAAKDEFDLGDIYIILCDNNKIGCVGWEEKESFFWFKSFFIHPDYQNQKMGSFLLKSYITQANNQKKPIRLRTLIKNDKAKSFYQAHGFIIISEENIHTHMVYHA